MDKAVTSAEACLFRAWPRSFESNDCRSPSDFKESGSTARTRSADLQIVEVIEFDDSFFLHDLPALHGDQNPSLQERQNSLSHPSYPSQLKIKNPEATSPVV